MKRLKRASALAFAPSLLVGAFFVASAGPASAAQPTAATVKASSSTSVASSSFVHEATGSGSGAWVTNKVAPSSTPRTYTFTVPATASECASIHQQHPDIRVGKTCENTETMTVGAARLVKQPAGVHGSSVRPDTTYYETYSDSLCSSISCAVWGNTVSTGFYFTGGEVWEDFVDCNDSRGTGFSVTVTWCGTWHDYATSQTGGYMNDGDDIEVGFLVKGVPIEDGHWQRLNCNVDGELWITSDAPTS